jgi:hypothetical protein
MVLWDKIGEKGRDIDATPHPNNCQMGNTSGRGKSKSLGPSIDVLMKDVSIHHMATLYVPSPDPRACPGSPVVV